MTTTFSQFIGPEENLSLSFMSTPGFQNEQQTPQINDEKSFMKDSKMHEKTEKEFQLEENPKHSSKNSEEQLRDNQLFFTLHRIKCDPEKNENYITFGQNINQKVNQNTGCTPISLLEKLRNYKHETKPQIHNSIENSLQTTFTAKESLIFSNNPVFKCLEELKRYRSNRLAKSSLGWHNKNLYKDTGLGELYKIPDETEIVDILLGSNHKLIESKVSNENSMLEKESYPLHLKESFKKNKKNKRVTFSSHTIIDQIITESSIIGEESSRKNSNKLISKSKSKSSLLKEFERIDAQSQTESQVMDIHQVETENLGKLSFEQLSEEIIKHLKMLEAVNNSQFSDKSAECKSYLQNECDVEKEEFQSDQSYESCTNESKYFKSSHSQFGMTPTEKIKVLEKFNQEQKEMFKKLFLSMISNSNENIENSKIFTSVDPKIENERKVFESLICLLSSEEEKKEKDLKEKEIKESEIVFEPPTDQSAMEVSLLTKTYDHIDNINPSKIINTFSEEKQEHHFDDGEFGKLEELMRDRELKESILGSNAADTSFNSESFLSIIDSEIVEKLKKFNPETLKKAEENQ